MELAAFFENLINQETLGFDVDNAIQFDRLSIPKRLDQIENELRANRIADPERLIPLLDKIEADQRVEDQEPRHFCIESPSQSRAIACGIEPQRGGEDEADVERAKIQAACTHICVISRTPSRAVSAARKCVSPIASASAASASGVSVKPRSARTMNAT